MALHNTLYEAMSRRSQVRLSLRDGREFENVQIIRVDDGHTVGLATANGNVEVSQLDIVSIGVRP